MSRESTVADMQPFKKALPLLAKDFTRAYNSQFKVFCCDKLRPDGTIDVIKLFVQTQQISEITVRGEGSQLFIQVRFNRNLKNLYKLSDYEKNMRKPTEVQNRINKIEKEAMMIRAQDYENQLKNLLPQLLNTVMLVSITQMDNNAYGLPTFQLRTHHAFENDDCIDTHTVNFLTVDSYEIYSTLHIGKVACHTAAIMQSNSLSRTGLTLDDSIGETKNVCHQLMLSAIDKITNATDKEMISKYTDFVEAQTQKYNMLCTRENNLIAQFNDRFAYYVEFFYEHPELMIKNKAEIAQIEADKKMQARLSQLQNEFATENEQFQLQEELVREEKSGMFFTIFRNIVDQQLSEVAKIHALLISGKASAQKEHALNALLERKRCRKNSYNRALSVLSGLVKLRHQIEKKINDEKVMEEKAAALIKTKNDIIKSEISCRKGITENENMDVNRIILRPYYSGLWTIRNELAKKAADQVNYIELPSIEPPATISDWSVEF